jgi:hypothetical protein
MFPDALPTPEARLVRALDEARPAAALELIDAADLPPEAVTAATAAVWVLAGSVRGLTGLAARGELPVAAGGAIGDALARLLSRRALALEDVVAAEAFPEADLPRGDPDALPLVQAAAANAGRAADLVRAHLALAEHAARVDLRVGHVEAAEVLARTLGDRRLRALVDAFLARLDADFGEAEDAVERAAEVLSAVTPAEAPRATAFALMVRRAVLQREAVPTPSGGVSEPDRAPHPLDASLPDLLSELGWSSAYPGPAWGLALP